MASSWTAMGKAPEEKMGLQGEQQEIRFTSFPKAFGFASKAPPTEPRKMNHGIAIQKPMLAPQSPPKDKLKWLWGDAQRSKTLCTAGLIGQMIAGPKAFTHRSLLDTSFQRALLCFAAVAQPSHLKGRSPGGPQRSKRSTVLQSQLPMQRGSLISTTAWWSKVRTLMTLCLSSCRALSNSLL